MVESAIGGVAGERCLVVPKPCAETGGDQLAVSLARERLGDVDRR